MGSHNDLTQPSTSQGSERPQRSESTMSNPLTDAEFATLRESLGDNFASGDADGGAVIADTAPTSQNK